MFETFDSAADAPSAGRLALSTTASLAVLGLLGLAVVTAAATVKQVIEEKKVEVVFRPPPPPPPPVAKVEPPPPPPPPQVKPAPPKPLAMKAPAPTTPVVAAPAPLVAPKEVPLEKPPEADAQHAVAAAPIAVGGTGRLVPGGVVGGIGTGEGGGLGAGRAPPINLPENATPPEALTSNLVPEYPSEARSRGQEGLVVLKGVVEVDGRVTGLQVLKGEEPFTSAAMQAARAWRFRPALVDGQPTAVYRIFKVPFRLKS
ncbi:TonB family protein [Myxococcaceae bacterium GXIMD 01537]